MANASLSLYQTCPPGLGGTDCTTATCDSPYRAAEQRTLKPSGQQSCQSCTAGFTGLDCNVCSSSTPNACGLAAAATGARVASNDELTCHASPRPISTNHVQCDINQPTLKTFYPGRSIQLTLTKVLQPDAESAAGIPSSGGQPNTTLSQIWLDGELQYYCQASNCSSSNSTTTIDSANSAYGSDVWACSNLQCHCLSNSTLCTGAGGGIAMGTIVNSLSGELSMPCDYTAPGTTSTKCQFKGGQLTTYLGPAGLPLENCQFGSCVTQTQLSSYYRSQSSSAHVDSGSHLSGPVIGGIAVLVIVVALLLSLLLCGFFQRYRAQRRATISNKLEPAVGISWSELDYRVASRTVVHKRPRWALGRGSHGAGAVQKNKLNSSRSVEEEKETREGDAERGSEHDVVLALGHDAPQGNSSSSSSHNHSGHVLKAVSGSAEPGSLVAILGPSGAGKTTLVELLAGKEKRGDIKGRIDATSRSSGADAGEDDDGHSLERRLHDTSSGRRLLAFVDQEDQLPAFSTVGEALAFAANLSLPENVSDEEKRGIVQGVITTLGLQAVAESLIGSRRRRGISGGEKRRVSIGIALVARPRILILDEPLSGLDAYNASRVMGALRQLASGHSLGATTVVLTLHQPSSQIFHSLDRAIVLASGRTLYDGAPSEALQWCQQLGHPCPTGHNVADHLLELAFKDDFSSDRHPSTANEQELSHVDVASLGSRNRTTTTWFTQFMTLSHRYILTARRDISGPLVHLIGHIALGLFVGGAFYQVKTTIGGFQNRIGSLYFIFLLMLFASMSAITFINGVRPLMVRERSDGLYSAWSWLIAHGIYDVVFLRLIPGLFLEIIAYWMIGLKHSAAYFFEFLLIANIFYLDVAMYMMTLGALFEDISISILAGAAFILLNIGMGGFLLNLATVPNVLRWIQWIAPLKYALEAVTINETEGLEINDQLGSLPVSTSASLVAPGLFGLTGSYYRDLLILALVWALGYAALLALSVSWRMKDRR